MPANIPTANNNPGNLKGNDGKFLTFKTPIEGQTALYNDLTVKMTGKSKTGLNGNSSLYQFAQKYAPKSDNNDPVNYAANLANELGVSPDTQIGTLMPRIDDFAKAIAKHEGYKGAWISGSKTPATTGGQLNNGKTQTTPVGNGFLPIMPVSQVNTPSAEQINPSFKQKVLNTGNTISNVMGMQPFGQGIATMARQAVGGGNEEKDQEASLLQQTTQVASKLHDLVKQGVPKNDPRRVQLANLLKQLSNTQTVKESEIDKGTTLSNKDVLKSAASTAGWALSGGSLPTSGMESGAIAQKGVNGLTQIKSPLLWQAGKAVATNPMVKNAVTGGGIMGNLIKAALLNKIIASGSGGKLNPGKYLIDAVKELE